jgi:pyrroloquinoline-quinone synthase
VSGPRNPAQFGAELMERILERRSLGGHPLWHRIAEGKADRSALQVFAVQFYLQVREFPRALSALHASCPYPEERRVLAERLYEVETGRLSGCGLSHPALFILCGEGAGLQRGDLVEGEPLPATAALVEWFRESTQQRGFLEGFAAIDLASEGQVHGAFGPFARALETHYGLSKREVSFWDARAIADGERRDLDDHVVVRLADTDHLQQKVRQAVETSLDRWREFFDGIDAAT